VALADKLDTLTGFWAIDEKPTGSKDPYALRRAALGVIRILLENEEPSAPPTSWPPKRRRALQSRVASSLRCSSSTRRKISSMR
jgi:hypothetical protein